MKTKIAVTTVFLGLFIVIVIVSIFIIFIIRRRRSRSNKSMQEYMDDISTRRDDDDNDDKSFIVIDDHNIPLAAINKDMRSVSTRKRGWIDSADTNTEVNLSSNSDDEDTRRKQFASLNNDVILGDDSYDDSGSALIGTDNKEKDD